MKKLLIFVLCATVLLALSGCSTRGNEKLPDKVRGTITFKDFGTVTFELYPNEARTSALNFIYLAKSGFYDGIIVHRLVNDFVIQAGAYEEGGNVREPDFQYTIKGEFSKNGVENSLKHELGTLSWARRGDSMDSASTQFFICTNAVSAAQLDGSYAPFGKVTEGLDVIASINEQPTASEVPNTEIVISSVTIDLDFDFPEPEFIKG